MFKKIIERSVRKEIALKSLEGKETSLIVENMIKERLEKEKAIAEVLVLKEKLEASARREKSLYKENENYSKEVLNLRNRIKELTEPMVIKISPRDEAKLKLNAQFGKPFDFDKLLKQIEDSKPIILSDKPQPITWCKFMKQPDGISDNLVDEDVNNLPFYTLEYSVDGQKESLINLSLHDCEELYGQIIGSLEYFKMTKQEKFINNIYSVWGDRIHIVKGVISHQEMINHVLSDGRMCQISKFRFYKNGKLFHEISGNKFIHTKIKYILKELEEKEKEKEIDEK